MKKIVLFISICLMFFTCKQKESESMNGTGEDQSYLGRVTASSLIVRDSPSMNGKVIGKISQYFQVTVLSQTDKIETIENKKAHWLKIVSPSGITGYSFGAFIERTKPDQEFGTTSKKTQTKKCPDTIDNSYECAKYREKILLTLLKNKVQRKDPTLFLTCENGETVTFTDKNEYGDGYKGFVLVDYPEEKKLFVVFVQYYEGGSCVLVNERNGEQIDIWEEPVFSPDGKKFICASLAGYGPNGLQIWSLQDNSFKKEFEKELDWGPGSPTWISDTHIDFTKEIMGFGGIHYFKASAVLEKGAWTIIH